ncbi:hypothetical protein [Sphingomonas sp. GC_Shp_3]|uniref:hypothetical protein n=1 Tax=Sphingomonas sp. GC_Shp_3 TaxID=2937383 RepID=UPI00226A9332|nr:hypothetical protein [Sphingomonas sp. GC_Shp_3]
MRVVIDTNSLETPELELFLEADVKNSAVLPEHTIAEIFKPRSLDAVFAAYSVLSRYPRQVLVLRTNRYVSAVDARLAAISNRFIDRDVTRSFPKFCEAIAAAQRGDVGMRKQLAKRRGWAQERVDRAEIAFGDQAETLAQLRDQFSPDDLRRMGAGETISQSARILILQMIHAVATDLALGHPAKFRLPDPPAQYYHFTWRYALCHLIQLLGLVKNGATRRAPAKARNDHFDNVFATFGSYFNGVMSWDKDVLETHAAARAILDSLGVRLAEDYIESGYILDRLAELEAVGKGGTENHRV